MPPQLATDKQGTDAILYVSTDQMVRAKMAYFRYLPGHSHDWRSMDRQGICAWAGLLAAPYGWLLFLQA